MTDHSVYFYNGRMALSHKHKRAGEDNLTPSIFDDIFENAYEAVFSSVQYTDYHECIKDSTAFIKEAASNFYNNDNFDLVWESNPSSKEFAELAPASTTGIKPWDPAEILRFYTLPKNLDENQPIIITLLLSIYGGNKFENVVQPHKTKH